MLKRKTISFPQNFQALECHTAQKPYCSTFIIQWFPKSIMSSVKFQNLAEQTRKPNDNYQPWINFYSTTTTHDEKSRCHLLPARGRENATSIPHGFSPQQTFALSSAFRGKHHESLAMRASLRNSDQQIMTGQSPSSCLTVPTEKPHQLPAAQSRVNGCFSNRTPSRNFETPSGKWCYCPIS